MEIKPEKFYKILHVPSGLFKSNGYNGDFSTVGKVWKGRNLKAHLRQFETYRGKQSGQTLTQEVQQEYVNGKVNYKHKSFDVDECVVVEFVMIGNKQTPLREFIENEMK